MRTDAANSTARADLEGRLQSIARQRAVWLLAARVIHVIAIVLFVWLTLVILDSVIVIPLCLRLAAMVMLAACAVWLFIRTVLDVLRVNRAKRVALDMEAQDRSLHNYVSTAVDYFRTEPVLAQERFFIDALFDKAWNVIRNVRHKYWQGAAKALKILTAASVLAAVSWFIPYSGIAWCRILTPWKGAVYALLAVKPTPDTVKEGEVVIVDVSVAGRGGAPELVAYRNSASRRIELKDLGNRCYRGVIPATGERLTYKVKQHYADSVSDSIVVLQTPGVVEWQIRAIPPSYTGKKTYVSQNGSLSAIRGTKLEIGLKCNTPLESAFLAFGEEEKCVELTRKQDGFYEASLTVIEDTFYYPRLTSRQGMHSRKDILYHINLIEDLEPDVEITLPEEDTWVLLGQDLEVAVTATDDFEVDSVVMNVGLGNGLGRRIDLIRQDGDKRFFAARTFLPFSEWGLKNGDIVVLQAEGKDNNAFSGAGIGLSNIRLIEIKAMAPDEFGDNSGGGGGGGGGGGQSIQINMTQVQRDILEKIRCLNKQSRDYLYADIEAAQRDNRQNTELLLEYLNKKGVSGSSEALSTAIQQMSIAEEHLAKRHKIDASRAGSAALAQLYRAAALFGEKSPGSGGGNSGVVMALDKLNEKQRQRSSQAEQAARDAMDKLQKARKKQEQMNKMFDQARQKPTPAGGDQSSGQQQALAGEMAEMAERWNMLAAANHKISHEVGSKLKDVSEFMREADRNQKTEEHLKALEEGGNAVQGLDDVIRILRKIAGLREQAVNLSEETCPAQFEKEVDEYFKNLSREE